MDPSITIQTYQPQFQSQIVQLILNIQQNEFGIPITAEDQPDLFIITDFYQKGGGNFWVATNEQKDVVGTIALIKADEQIGAIRKMFVHTDYRGSIYGIASKLLVELENWALNKGLSDLYLGTIDLLKGAIKFYTKNGFKLIEVDQLPASFPRMKVDTLFYHKKITL
ncbi:GNAT family N-acetyltransferase [Solitalea sp. MAHUQ-68]|uniref:GNAT family N-acetyltransferase n=1 Tax=Solitalea agri TaxID=2953739 RepID=A0A9X2F5S8_9SPHI|nr:GNAT family N-acetyltransferase [Solitalea agri]MCO4291343.1 GNAT family N-acetyltransferase [Solitalea agri]